LVAPGTRAASGTTADTCCIWPPKGSVDLEKDKSVLVNTVVVVVPLGAPKVTPATVMMKLVAVVAEAVNCTLPLGSCVGAVKMPSGDCPVIESEPETPNKLELTMAMLSERSCVWVVKEIVTVLPWFVGTLSAMAIETPTARTRPPRLGVPRSALRTSWVVCTLNPQEKPEVGAPIVMPESVTVKAPPSNFFATVSVNKPDAEATLALNESAGVWPPIVTDAEEVSKNVGGKNMETKLPDANVVWVVKETVIDFDLAVGILSAELIDNATPDTWPPSLSENVVPGLSVVVLTLMVLPRVAAPMVTPVIVTV